MDFAVGVMVVLAALVGVLLLIGRFYPGSGAEQLDWKPARSHEQEVALEFEDIDQMLEAQNERRRRRGEAELSEDALRSEVEGEERERRARAERYRGPGGD